MKTVENDPRWYFRPFNGLLNWLAVDTDRITSEASAIGPWGRAETNGTKPEWIDVSGKLCEGMMRIAAHDKELIEEHIKSLENAASDGATPE